MMRNALILPLAAALAFAAAPAPAAIAAGARTGTEAEAHLGAVVRTLEADLGARIGVLVRDTATEWAWGHRQNERFLMASTFKSLLCAAVLDRADDGTLSLAEPIPVRAQDMVEYAPVTETRVGGTMTAGELCLATLDLSDNPAANILIGRLGGSQAVTAFLRGIGDEVTRLDRMEPELNIFAPGDPRDTTTPAAMLSTWQAVLRGPVLSPTSRATLEGWMSHGGVTGALIRAHTPAGWSVADKSGAGRGYTRNLVAMVTPPQRESFLVAIFVSDTPADLATRSAAVAQIGAAVIEVLQAR